MTERALRAGSPSPVGGPSGDFPLVCVCVRTSCTLIGGKIDSGMRDPAAELQATVAEIVQNWHGGIASDGECRVVCRFAGADDALRCAQSIQRAIVASNRPQWIGARIGCCALRDVADGADGWEQVRQCAHRLADRAQPGQIIASAQMATGLDATLRRAVQPLDAGDWASDRTGIGISLCQVTWQDDVGTRLANPVLSDNPVTRVERLQLHWRGEHLVLDARTDVVTIGRSQRADITIESEYASRIHAELCYQDACFVLTDCSTNGTYVKHDEDEIYLHDDRYILHGEGAISLGRRSASARGRVVFFKAETAQAKAQMDGRGA
ncbi:MAG: FHA domain-containing protein [Gammaproteobacteria bacterium]|nr:FHA domain-containing protein [Gammaproteobacteria bacterium]